MTASGILVAAHTTDDGRKIEQPVAGARLPGPDQYWNVTLLDAAGHRVLFHSY